MNAITYEVNQDRRNQAQELYSLGYASILSLCLISACGLGVTIWIQGDAQGTRVLAWTATIAALINLAYILIDTNFRVSGEYTFGIKILSVARLADFISLVCFLALTKSVIVSLLLNVATRALIVVFLKAISERRERAMSPSMRTLNIRAAPRHIILARGQFGLSTYTALSAMGPQLVVSSFFPGPVAVAFNVHRTFLRIVTALVNIVTASSWPVLNEFHATGRYDDLTNFLKKLITRSIAASAILCLGLMAAAPPLFPILFHGKVTADYSYLIPIGLACVFNSGTTLAQTLYLATNLRSTALLIAILLTGAELALVTYVGLKAGFVRGLTVYAFIELLIMLLAIFGSRKTLQTQKAGHQLGRRA